MHKGKSKYSKRVVSTLRLLLTKITSSQLVTENMPWNRRFLPKQDRLDYIAAVYCLREKPSLFSPEDVPGSRNLLDSVTAVHINLTDIIHGNVSLQN